MVGPWVIELWRITLQLFGLVLHIIYLDTFIKDITKLPWVKYVLNKIRHDVNFVMKEPKFFAIYRTFQDLELLKFSKTKYAHYF
jgi:predicted tellurium resistance membrane protein TerC